MYLKHGKTKTPEYLAWCRMRARCLKPDHLSFSDYGGRGITICQEWATFERFLSDMGERPTPKHSIDRIDNNGNYEPTNCRWALSVNQCNNRRSNRIVIWNGVPQTLAQVSRLEGSHYPRVADRVRRGWSLEDAIRQPANQGTPLTYRLVR